MEVRKIQCDNPACSEIADSESAIHIRGKLLPPFGWLSIRGSIGYFGCGPYTKNIVVHDISCLKDAVMARLNEADVE